MTEKLQTGPGSAAAGGVVEQPPSLSLVMATYGRAEELKPAIGSLLAQTDRKFELIVVDQNKDDRIVPMLRQAREAGLEVRHIRQDIPNLSLARNVGLDHARGAIIAFPDDDCWYEPDVVATVRQTFLARSGSLDGIVARWVESDPEGKRPQDDISGEAWRRFRGGDATSFTLFLPTDRLREIGGFDPMLGTGRWFGAAEETDLILRLLASGARLRYVPDARIHHAHADWPAATRGQCRRERMYGRGTGALYCKHTLSPWVVARGLVGPLIRALGAPRPLGALALGACAVWGRIEGMAGWCLGLGRNPR
jgi:hypothetical protein